MIKLNRTTEYALIALRYIGKKSAGDVASAREIADHYGLPFEITAKTLLRLKDAGLIGSEQGVRGGYSLQKQLGQVNLAEFIDLMEGRQSIVPCVTDAIANKNDFNQEVHPPVDCCAYGSKCELKSIMGNVQTKLNGLLSKIPLSEITEA